MKSFLVLSSLLAVVLAIRAAAVIPAVTVATAITNVTTSMPQSTVTTSYTTPDTTPENTSSLPATYFTTTTSPCFSTPGQPVTTQAPTSQSQLLCHPGWEAFEGRCYYFVNENLLWPQAQSYCAMLDATLVSIHSPQEYGFLQQLTTTNGQSSAWIGGFYLQYEWMWLDGSWFLNNTNSWSVQNQFSSNPCLQLNTYEGWSNVPCNLGENSAICAKDSNVPQAMMCPDGWTMFKGRCYYFESEDMTWPQADANCATLEAGLVSVHSPQEYAFLQQMSGSFSWLGGIYFQNQWMWLDGSWLYQGFFTDMSYPNSEFACLGISNNDGWSNYGCDRSLASICVKDAI